MFITGYLRYIDTKYYRGTLRYTFRKKWLESTQNRAAWLEYRENNLCPANNNICKDENTNFI